MNSVTGSDAYRRISLHVHMRCIDVSIVARGGRPAPLVGMMPSVFGTDDKSQHSLENCQIIGILLHPRVPPLRRPQHCRRRIPLVMER